MSLKSLLTLIFLFGVTMGLLSLPAAAQKKNDSVCSKPPELLPPPKPTKEEQEKLRRIKAQGVVEVSISEDGDVVEAKVIRANSPAAGDLLLARAKAMKFKPRSGCGVFKFPVNFTIGN